jgi:DeoR family transcriptional regulator of aga operon
MQMKRERIEKIAALIDKRGKLSLKQLGEYFPRVSQMTLRRDLFLLEEEGKIIRVRGGAMSVKDVQKTSGEPYTKKTTIHTDEKIVIAQKAAALIDQGASIFIDAGTTALYLAKEMPDIPCNVFTNGLAVATELCKKKNVMVNLLGGPLIKENLSTASSLSSIYFADMNFELAIISAAAFTPESGFSCGSQMEADLFKIVCKKAKFTYMMLDSSKIGKIKPYTFARAEDINVLITDDVFPEGLKDEFKAKNIVVM